MSRVSLDHHLSHIAETLQDAAVGQSGWDVALTAIADATGAKAGELIGLGHAPFQIITEFSAEEMAAFSAVRGHDVAVNSRVRVGMDAPVLTLLDESDFDTENDCRRNLEYGDAIRRLDIPFAQITVLHRSSEVTMGLSMLRTARAGDMPIEQKRLLQAVAPHVASAVRLHLAAESRAMDLTAAGFGQADLAAFVTDRAGRVKALSAPAERLLLEGDLRLVNGRLSTRGPRGNSLGLAIERACKGTAITDAPPETLLTCDSAGLAYPVEVMPLPPRHGFDFEAGVVVLARPPRAIEHRAARTAAGVFGLTRAEAAVAGLLVSGLAAGAIAERQGVAVGTVRTHIRRLFDKTGAKNQLALVAAVVARL